MSRHDAFVDVLAELHGRRHGPVGPLALLLAEQGERPDVVGAARHHGPDGDVQYLAAVVLSLIHI